MKRSPDAVCGSSLSAYWRTDTSEDRSRELTSVLGGAASMAELVQSKFRNPGAAPTPPSPVVLDPRLLAGFTAPVPARVVDCLVGIAVREAGFRELSADTSTYGEWSTLSGAERSELRTVHHSLEDYYISQRLRGLSPVLGCYLGARARVVVAPLLESWRESAGGAPTREGILEAWLAIDLYGAKAPDDMDPRLRSAVVSLRTTAVRYAATNDAGSRLAIAVDAWRWLREYPRGASLLGAAVSRDVRSETESGDTASHDARMRRNIVGGGEAGSLVDLSTRLVDEPRSVEPEGHEAGEAPASGMAVLTADLRDLGVLAAKTMLIDAEFDPVAYEHVRDEVLREITAMRRLFSRLDEVESRWRHGLRRGKLDGRRLSRVASDKETVFKLRDRRHRSSMALVFLIDVSASMKSHMSTVNRAACVVSEALRGLEPAVWHDVLTYTSGGLHPGAPVQLTRLASATKTLSLNGVWSEGGTPTGEAIAAALLQLRGRPARRRLIIHFTDGHPKNTYVVRQALELCRRENVDVVTVSVGTPQESLYGAGRCAVAYTVSELPDVLFRLLPRLYR